MSGLNVLGFLKSQKSKILINTKNMNTNTNNKNKNTNTNNYSCKIVIYKLIVCQTADWFLLLLQKYCNILSKIRFTMNRRSSLFLFCNVYKKYFNFNTPFVYLVVIILIFIDIEQVARL